MKTDFTDLLRYGLLCGGLAASAAWAHGATDKQAPPSAAPAGQETPTLQNGKEKMQSHKQPSERSTRQIPSPQTADPGQRDEGAAGTDARDSKAKPGSTTGSTGHGGLQGSGASSGSGGTPDMRD